MEAALRTVVEVATGKDAPSLDFKQVRGTKGIKEAAYDVNGVKVKVAVCSGLANAREIMDKVRAGKADYHFIEVMACPGGCVGGGGQPLGVTNAVREARMAGLTQDDRTSHLRCSHQNPDIKKLYQDFLGKPLSEKAHHLLHTHYHKRPLYK